MPWSPLPTPDARSDAGAPTPVNALLDAVLAGLGAPTAEAIVVLHEQWDRVVGPEVAAHAHPIAVEDGVLRVGVDSPAWANHLRWSEAEVVARAGELVGASVVRSVTVRVSRR